MKSRRKRNFVLNEAKKEISFVFPNKSEERLGRLVVVEPSLVQAIAANYSRRQILLPFA